MADEEIKALEEAKDVTPPVEPVEETKPDLEKERDLRVVPVAQSVIEAFAGQKTAVDVNDRSEFTNLLISILKGSLGADLNLTTDVPYVFQLVLSGFGAFNKMASEAKKPETNTLRYSIIAHEMMMLFAKAKVPMGDGVKSEDQAAALDAVRSEMEALFERENLNALEVTYILEGLMNALRVTEQSFRSNIQDSVERMEAKILKLPHIGDLTMKKLDTVLSSSFEDLEKAGEVEDVK